MPDFESLKRRLGREHFINRWSHVKIIPLMFLAGIHVEKDLMGDRESWRTALESLGFTVSCAVVHHENDEYFKGLGFYPELIDFYLNRLSRAIELARYY